MAEPIAAKVGESGILAGEPYTVKATCGGTVGRWACLTHDKVFVNQFYKDTHIGDSKEPCTLGWICPEHGVETP